MKNVLLTGSNGFIGRYLSNSPIMKDYNLLCGTTSACKSKNQQKFFKNYANVARVLHDTDIDAIVHLAAVIPESFAAADSSLFFANCRMMINLYNFAVQRNVGRFVYLSSFGSMNFPDKYDIKDFYTLAKVTGEHICSMMHSAGIAAVSLRIPSPFGEYYNSANVLSVFIDRALRNQPLNVYGSGRRRQNFIYVGNIAECIKKALETRASGVFDLVAPCSISMQELAELIVRLAGSKSAIRTGNVADPLEDLHLPDYSLSRLENELHYREVYAFEDSLKSYIEWRRASLTE